MRCKRSRHDHSKHLLQQKAFKLRRYSWYMFGWNAKPFYKFRSFCCQRCLGQRKQVIWCGARRPVLVDFNSFPALWTSLCLLLCNADRCWPCPNHYTWGLPWRKWQATSNAQNIVTSALEGGGCMRTNNSRKGHSGIWSQSSSQHLTSGNYN